MSPWTLYRRFRSLVHEGAKFGIIGVFNIFVNLGVTNLAQHTVFHHQPIRASIVGTVVATLSAYLLNKYWAFRHREQNHSVGRETLLFAILNGIGMSLDWAGVTVVYYLFGFKSTIGMNVGKLVGIIAGTAFRFWAYRQFVWTKQTDLTPEQIAAELEREGMLPPEVPHQVRTAEPVVTGPQPHEPFSSAASPPS